MEISPAQPVPKESSDQWESWQLVKLSHKLRWIGMEREAELVMNDDLSDREFIRSLFVEGVG